MFTYIVRRILYSIPVLFLSTYMSFLFVSYAGDPTGNLRNNPHINPHTIQVSLAAPYPGTYLHRQAVENGTYKVDLQGTARRFIVEEFGGRAG